MGRVEPTDETLAQIFIQRRQAVHNLVGQFKGLVGKNASREVIIPLFIALAGELGNFYRLFELESKMINALQKEIEVLAPRSAVRDSQKGEGSYRCPICERRCWRAQQPTRFHYRERVRRYVQRQRSRDLVYRAKGSAAHEGRRVNHSE